jgi:hypothetical protein
VWERYCEGWRQWRAVENALERVPRPTDLFADVSRYPVLNREREDSLCAGLLRLPELTPADAAGRLRDLDAQHAERRHWLWAQMDRAPLATALAPLAALVDQVAKPFGGQDMEVMAAAYREELWQVDARALEALGRVKAKG